MAIIIEGDSDIFAAMRYGVPTRSMAEYVEDSYRRASGMIGDFGKQLFDQTYQGFQDALSSNAFRVAKAAMRRVGSIWGGDDIRRLTEIWEVQNAHITMARYVMAHPGLRRLYHNQSAAGYDTDYVDLQPDAIGEQHNDWCRVNDGIAIITDDGWTATTYSNCTDTDENELTLSEQMDILESWETVDYAIAQGIDPSSRYDFDL